MAQAPPPPSEKIPRPRLALIPFHNWKLLTSLAVKYSKLTTVTFKTLPKFLSLALIFGGVSDAAADEPKKTEAKPEKKTP